MSYDPLGPMEERVRVVFDSGFPTLLPRKKHLADMLRQCGQPRFIRAQPGGFALIEWAPIYPGVPIPQYHLAYPYPGERRTIVGVRLDNPQEVPQ